MTSSLNPILSSSNTWFLFFFQLTKNTEEKILTGVIPFHKKKKKMLLTVSKKSSLCVMIVSGYPQWQIFFVICFPWIFSMWICSIGNYYCCTSYKQCRDLSCYHHHCCVLKREIQSGQVVFECKGTVNTFIDKRKRVLLQERYNKTDKE